MLSLLVGLPIFIGAATGTCIVSTLAGGAGGNASGSANGIGTAATFSNPNSVVIDSTTASVFVTDFGNYMIRRVDMTTSAVTTLAGSPTTPGSSDGIGTAASFFIPSGAAFDDRANNLYIAGFHSHCIRVIAVATATVSTFLGVCGNAGYADGVGTAAVFNNPLGCSVDSGGGKLCVPWEGGRGCGASGRSTANIIIVHTDCIVAFAIQRTNAAALANLADISPTFLILLFVLSTSPLAPFRRLRAPL